MIIADDIPASPSKNAQILPQEPHAQPPPAYPGPASHPQIHSPQSYLEAGPSSPAAPPRDTQHSPLLERVDSFFADVTREPAGKRFIAAFAYAALIWLLLAMVTRSIFELSWNAHRGKRWEFPDWTHDDDPDGTVAHPLPSDGTVERCISGASQWYLAYSDMLWAGFELPLSADVHSLFTRGAIAGGNVVFQGPQSDQADNVIRVGINAKMHSKNALDFASVCHLKKDKKHSIGFFAPKNSSQGRLDFDITVHFPAPERENRPVRVKRFESEMTLFDHRINSLPRVHFDALQITTRNTPISVDSLSADFASLRTTNHPIKGTFEAALALELITTNAPIDASITLFHDGASRTPTEIVLQTANAPIDSTVQLISTARNAQGGRFRATAFTTNGPLTLSIPRSPPRATLDAQLRATNAPAAVELPAPFEGEFVLSTTNAAPAVHANSVQDPENRGRQRSVQTTIVRTAARGRVFWAPARSTIEGVLDVGTTNAPVTLDFL